MRGTVGVAIFTRCGSSNYYLFGGTERCFVEAFKDDLEFFTHSLLLLQ